MQVVSVYSYIGSIYHKLLHMGIAVKTHALPVYKKHRIASLLCIFESTINIIICHCCSYFSHKSQDFFKKKWVHMYEGLDGGGGV